jgi:hypothetical protein
MPAEPEVLGVSGQKVLTQDDTAVSKDIGILLVDDNVRYLHQLQRVLGKCCPQPFFYEAETHCPGSEPG